MELTDMVRYHGVGEQSDHEQTSGQQCQEERVGQ